ncbi:hypothetical protein HY489_01785 [Candidatus Woesearchaeota archaeon]|nr:hypothetical protein [Candidatus Woesearchaeota archaeon]
MKKITQLEVNGNIVSVFANDCNRAEDELKHELSQVYHEVRQKLKLWSSML